MRAASGSPPSSRRALSAPMRVRRAAERAARPAMSAKRPSLNRARSAAKNSGSSTCTRTLAPGRELARLGREHQQPLREHHRAQHARALVARARGAQRAAARARARRARSACGPGSCAASRRGSPRPSAGTSARWPASFRSTGRTNCSKVTIAETGLPGQAEHQRPALAVEAAERRAGSRASCARPRRASRQPSFSSTGRTWSWSPTETPARAHEHVGVEPGAQQALELLGRVARDAEERRLGAGLAALRGDRVGVRGHDAPAAPAAPSGSTSSSPPERIATRGRRWTATPLRPSDASMPSCDGPSASPGASTRSPARTSSPAGRTWSPARGGRAEAHAARRRRSTSSCITTASAPAGIGAPVKMRAASPGARAPRAAAAGGDLEGDGERDRRPRRRRRGPPLRTA